jgi:hypothetical protein
LFTCPVLWLAETYTDLFHEQPFFICKRCTANYKKKHYMITAYATKVIIITLVTNGYCISVLANCVPTAVMGLIEIVVLVVGEIHFSQCYD